MAEKQTAGARLRAVWAAELAAVDPELEFTPADEQHLGAASGAADRAEVLRAAFAAESAGEGRPAELVRLSSELRLLDRAVADHLGRVVLGEGPAKSPQHRAAANARWDARRAEHERNRQAAYGTA